MVKVEKGTVAFVFYNFMFKFKFHRTQQLQLRKDRSRYVITIFE